VEIINRHDADSFPTLHSGASLVHQVETQNLGLLADTYHMHIEEPALSQPLHTYADLVWHVHLSDTERRAPGWGDLDFREIAVALRETHYQGFLGVEVLQIPDFYAAAQQSIRHLSEIAR
jgi:sugar phosphate isomerase/epimerase